MELAVLPVLLCVLVSCASSEVVQSSSGQDLKDATSDKFVDLILTRIKEHIAKDNVEPMAIPDFQVRSDHHIRILHMKHHLKVYGSGGSITGLQSLKRYGVSSFKVDNITGVFKMVFGFSYLDAHYHHIKVHFGPIHFDFKGVFKLYDTSMEAVLNLDLATSKFSLQSFNVINIGRVSVTVRGEDPFGRLVTDLLHSKVHQIRDKLIPALSNGLRGSLSKAVEGIDISTLIGE